MRRAGLRRLSGGADAGPAAAGAALCAMWHDRSDHPSTPRASVIPGPKPRSGSSWPRHQLTGCTSHGELSLYGLRRGEVLGLRWSDIDLRARTLTVNKARVLVEYRVRIEEPRSRNGKRTLPLDAELAAALWPRCANASWRRVRPLVRPTGQESPSWIGTREAST